MTSGPSATCQLCGATHTRPTSRYCGDPCNPLTEALVTALRMRPCSWKELVAAVSAPPLSYSTTKTRVVQRLKPLIKRGFLREHQATLSSPTVVYVPSMEVQAYAHARALDTARRTRIAYSDSANPRHPGARAKRAASAPTTEATAATGGR